jgi:hypothetical protein
MTTGSALTQTRNTATPSLQSAQRQEVERALEAPRDGYVDAKGEFQVCEGTWRPVAISAAAKAEARAELDRLAESLEPAGKERMAQWLATLGTISATGNMTVADAKAKLGAYASLLAYPVACLTRESLDRAGRAFKWFPTYAEIAEFLDAEQRRVETRRKRLERLLSDEERATKAEPKPKRYADASDEDRARIDARLAELKAAKPMDLVRRAATKAEAPTQTPEEVEAAKQEMLRQMQADPDFADVLTTPTPAE